MDCECECDLELMFSAPSTIMLTVLSGLTLLWCLLQEKKSMQQREREERVKEAELTNLQGPRHQEMLTLSTMLAQRGLQVHQVKFNSSLL